MFNHIAIVLSVFCPTSGGIVPVTCSPPFRVPHPPFNNFRVNPFVQEQLGIPMAKQVVGQPPVEQRTTQISCISHGVPAKMIIKQKEQRYAWHGRTSLGRFSYLFRKLWAVGTDSLTQVVQMIKIERQQPHRSLR